MKAWIRDIYIAFYSNKSNSNYKKGNTKKMKVDMGGMTKKYRTSGRGVKLKTGYEIQDFIDKVSTGQITVQ